MAKHPTCSISGARRRQSLADWERVDRQTVAEIAAAVVADPDQFIPDERHLKQARASSPVMRQKRVASA